MGGFTLRFQPVVPMTAFRLQSMAGNDPKQPFKICRNRKTKLKKLVPFIALIWVATSGASDPAPDWGDWQAHVWNTYCELSKEYYIPFRNDPSRRDPNRRGFLSGTTFDRAFVRFTANPPQLHGESHGAIRFSLHVYPEDPPTRTIERIVDATLGGFRSEANMIKNDRSRTPQTFLLGEDESAQLLQRFTDSETVQFELKFANGDEKQFRIYPSGDRTFYVWAEMFQTCIRSHKGKKR